MTDERGEAGREPTPPSSLATALADPWLWFALALGAALRAWGLAYGLPHVYNPDEVSIMSRALGLANSGLNPHNFLYPSFFFYMLAGVVGLVAVFQVATGTVPSLAGFEAAFWTDPSTVYLAGRSVSLVTGTLTVGTTYVLGSCVGTVWTARLAALLYAVAYIPVRDAHFVKHDVPTTFLVSLVALAAHRLWRCGRNRDVAAAAAAAGLAFATHYYAVFSTVLVGGALWLRSMAEHPRRTWLERALDVLGARRTGTAAAVFLGTFFVLSPFVLVDWRTAWRDIAANRAILVDRAHATYGAFGALDEHLRILVGQGTGVVFFGGVLFGTVLMARTRMRTAIWLLPFPLIFLVFLSNSWPFGRTANVLYPFLAVACGYGCAEGIARGRRWVLAACAVACAWAPLNSATIIDRLMTRTDTRTLSLEWLSANVPDEAGVAVEPYSVPLIPSREWLRRTLEETRGSVDHAGYRSRTLLDRTPYPSPAYRVFTIGEGGLDEDKRYISPDVFADSAGLQQLRAEGLQFVVLKRFSRHEPNLLRTHLANSATLVHVVSPFVGEGGEEAQLPDYDIPPTRDVERPGPLIEIWRLR